MKKFIRNMVIYGGMSFAGLSIQAHATPAAPIFAVPANEYFYNSSGTTVNFSVSTDAIFTANTSWALLNITSPTASTIVCNGSVAPEIVLYAGVLVGKPKNYNLSCALPFLFGETRLQIYACGPGGACTSSLAKNVTQYKIPATPSLGYAETNLVSQLYSDYKVNEKVVFDLTYYAEEMRGVTFNVRDNATNAYLCSSYVPPSSIGAQALRRKTSCNTTFPTPGNRTVYVEACYAGKLACSGKSASNSFVVNRDAWAELSDTQWHARAWPFDKHIQFNHNTSKTIAAYYNEWSVYARQFYPKNIPVENLTYIYHAFIGICGNNQALLAAQNQNIAVGNPSRPHQMLVDSCAGKNADEVSIHDRDAAILSGLQINGGQLDTTEKVTDPVRGIFAEYYRMKKVHPFIKILPAIGGANMSDPLFAIAKNPARRAVFIKSAVNFIHKYDFFDGINLDWQFPVAGGLTAGLASPQDAQAYLDLIRELRIHLDELKRLTNRTYEIHATFGGTPSQIHSLILDGMAADRLNFMTLDYYGVNNNQIGHHSAIKDVGEGTPIAGSSADDLWRKAYFELWAESESISIGIAAYARGWDGIIPSNPASPISGSLTSTTPSKGIKAWLEPAEGRRTGRWEAGFAEYKGLEANEMKPGSGWSLISDATYNAHQYLWNPATGIDLATGRPTGSLLSLDTEKSVDAKAKLILQHSLGGAVIWSIDGDNGTLLNALHNVFDVPL